MKCPHCNTNVSKIPMNWKCLHCGENLPEPGFWYKFSEGLTDYLVEKGAIFWGVIFGFVLFAVGVVEIIFGRGILLGYIGKNFLFAIAMLFYGGMIIDMYMKIVLPLHIPYGSDFILRERRSIRNIRKGSHIAMIVGVLFSILWLGPKTFLEYFPAYLVVIGWFLALSWAIAALFLDPRMNEDIRFRFFMDRLGITGLKRFRKIGTNIIGALFISGILFFVMINIPLLPQKISNWAILGAIIFFFKNYLGWLL